MNRKVIVKTIQNALKKRAPEILMGIGITGVITTSFLASKATLKAKPILDELKEKHKDDKIPAKEFVVEIGPCYVSTLATGVASIACILGANHIHSERNVALATACKLTETAFTEFKGKVKEVVEPEKMQEIKEKIAADKVKNAPIADNKNEIIVCNDDPTELFLDSVTGQYFNSTKDEIKDAFRTIRDRAQMDSYASLNELFNEVDVPNVLAGELLGWNSDIYPETPEFIPEKTRDGRLCWVMEYDVEPRYDFRNLH